MSAIWELIADLSRALFASVRALLVVGLLLFIVIAVGGGAVVPTGAGPVG